MAKNNHQDTKIATKTVQSVTIAASLMLATSTVAMFLSWGMMATVGGLQSLRQQVVRTALNNGVNPISIELRVPDYVRDYQILRHPATFLPGQRIRARGTFSVVETLETVTAKIKGANTFLQKNLEVVQATEEIVDMIIPHDLATDNYTLDLTVNNILFQSSLKIVEEEPLKIGGGGALAEEDPLSAAILYSNHLNCIDPNTNNSQGRHCNWESVLTGHPLNPDILTYGYSPLQGPRVPPFYYSTNGGKSWQPFKMENFTLGRFCCDPKAKITSEGNALFVGLPGYHFGDISSGSLKTSVIKSVGRERQDYDRPVLAYDYETKTTYIAAHGVDFSVDGEIYTEPGLFISRDDGNTFSDLRLDPGGGSNGNLLKGVPEVTSLDVGQNHLLRGLTVEYYGIDKPIQAEIRMLKFNQMVDSYELVPVVQLKHWIDWPPWSGPEIAIDNGINSRHRGRIYVSWSEPDETIKNPDQMFARGKNFNIYMAYSDNDGQVWSQPIRVSKGNINTDSKFPNIKIDSEGTVHLAYYMYIQGEGYDAYYALYKNGFVSESIRVNSKIIYSGIGDYIDMLVAYPDKAYVSYPCSVASEYRGIPISINDECVAAIDPNLVAFPPAPKFLRGDVNNDGTLNITDPINILGFLFLGNPTDLQCEDAADANDSGNINITDSIHLLNYLFNPNPTDGTDKIPLPYPDKDSDPTADSIGCDL